jgi:serine/threonine protein kinase
MSESTHSNDSGDRGDAPGARAARSSRDAGVRTAEQVSRGAVEARDLGSVVANRYILKRRLGTGRYGEIYEAVDRSLSDPQMQLEHSVALHLLHPRIAKHTRLLQKLESSYLAPHLWAHPNLVKLTGFGCDNGQYFLVTELLDGATLRTLLDATPHGRRLEADKLAVLRGVGDALKYAHANGAIHGDVRAEKIFITNDHAVKVLDLLPASSPRAQPFFVEDEEPSGLAAPDARDDVYGLASVAYELLAGRLPFDGRSPLEALHARTALAPIPGLDARRSDALARALRLRREHRTATVSELLADLGVTGPATPRPAAETASAPPVRADVQDDDVPIIGDYSHRVLSEPPAEPVLQAEPPRAANREGESWRHDPRDVNRYAERARRGGRRPPGGGALRFAILALVVVAAGVGVYWNYEPLRAQAEQWLAAMRGAGAGDPASIRPSSTPLDESEEIVVEAPVVVESADLPAEVADPPQAAVPDAAAPAIEPRVPAPPIAEPPAERPAAEPPGLETRPDLPPRPEELAVDVPPALELPAAEPPAAEPTPAEQAAAAPSPEAEAVAVQPEPPAAPPAPETFEVPTSVSVSERAAGARVTIRRRGGDLGESSIAWWTTDGSAKEGDDYANLGRMTERFAAGEEVRAIYVPIIGDSTTENPETFFVNLGASGEAGDGRDAAGRVEIIVTDDD